LKRTGAVIHAPCVNRSNELTCICGMDVFIGFIHIKDLEGDVIRKIRLERCGRGNFLHLQDFMERTQTGPEQLNTLIRVGAFRFTGKNKKELLWEANFLQKRIKHRSINCHTLFEEKPVVFNLPLLQQTEWEDAMDEIELLGFPLGNPFGLIDFDRSNFVASKNLLHHLGKEVNVVGYYVTHKPVYTVKKEWMCFGTFLDPYGDWLDTVHFPAVAERNPLSGKGFYQLKGKVVEEFGVYSVEVKSLEKLGVKGNRR
jgi:DNA polymerase III alpha subunit